jgi:hypothetical protein
MRTTMVMWQIALLLSLTACTKSTESVPDTTPPHAEVFLGVYLLDGSCPARVSFYINPRNSSDNISSNDDLKIRWDFDNDGAWDTEFGAVESIVQHQPHPLPVTSWMVTCEISDLAGNATVHSESVLLPDWVPVVPDVVAGEIRISVSPFASNDTICAGEDFIIFLSRGDWVNDSSVRVTQKYFIDGEQIDEGSDHTSYPHPSQCWSSGVTVPGGISTLGPHTISVKTELSDGIIETNLENNVSSCVVYIVE